MQNVSTKEMAKQNYVNDGLANKFSFNIVSTYEMCKNERYHTH